MKKNSRPLRKAWMLLSLAIWWNPGAIWAGSPAEQIMSTVTEVREYLREAASRDDTRRKQRQEQLRQIISSRFDFDEMGKRSLGAYWRRYPARQEEFLSTFSDFARNFYLNIIGRFKNAKVLYTREFVDGDFSQVDTRIVPLGQQEVRIQYRMRLVGGEWKVYDVHIQRSSFVNLSRSQFSRILAGAPFDDLLRRLGERQGEEMFTDEFQLNPAVPYLLLSARPRF